MKENILPSDNPIQDIIYDIRGAKVMLDYDLASMYEVDVSQLKRQVRRNIDRFPEDFMFELTAEEVSALRCQNGILKTGRANTVNTFHLHSPKRGSLCCLEFFAAKLPYR